MDYSKLSDRDIDALVLQQIYGNQASDKDIVRSWLRGGFKYTANPADAWPIIQDNRISLVIDDTTNEWSSALVNDFSEDSAFQHSNANKNPLRAAMITFLMMQESQHA
ncbi:DUF2591 domain-containing protein [Cronobacter sakazakii]|uniref:phage protein NinX family protein n=1 Tax=Cronobacter sakazakii TaxID=28141 RepID=UPI000A1D836A|nr:phage protein NinX family protein [Cronobacter sakazakii]PUY28605.1 DUF2591 domain-containing protein [Cronobacter sakazakii]